MNCKNKYFFIGMIVLQSIFYGIMDPVAKIAYKSMPVYSFLTVRYVIATGIMFVIWRKKILQELKNVSFKIYIIPSICMASAFIFSNMALRYTAATNVAFLRSLSALIAPLLMSVIFRKRHGSKEIGLQLVMLAGLYLLCAKGGLSTFGIGEVLSLVAATLVAGALVFGEKTLNHISAITLSFVQSTLAIIICSIMGFATRSFSGINMLSISIVLSLFYAAIFCTIGGYMLQNVALKHISAKTVGMIQCLYPVMTAVVAFVMLGEMLSILGLIGAGIITVCAFLESSFNEQKEKNKLIQVENNKNRVSQEFSETQG